MEFTIRTGKEVANAKAQTHKAALVKYLTARRRAVLRAKDPDSLFSALPTKAVVSGIGSSKTFRVKWEKVGKTKFPGSRYVFSVEKSSLGRIIGALRSGRARR